MRRLVALLALAVVALVGLLPTPAMAALLPVCELEEATTSRSPLPPEPSCSIVTTVDELGEVSAAPICDASGVSAVAPARILPVSDARIDVAPGCGQRGPALYAGSPAPERPMDFEPAASPYAVLVAPTSLPRMALVDMSARPEIAGGIRPGFEQGVYHPPR